MAIGLVGQKCGMSRIFTEQGDAIPVSVIRVEPNRVMQVKVPERDGYSAVQIGVGERKPSRVNKAMAGHYSVAQTGTAKKLVEFRLEEGAQAPALSDVIDMDVFQAGQKVDVRGVTIGKGFAGVIKRYNFNTQDATHGNSLSHRAPGSIGQNQTPGRVFKGKRMAGHMGAVNCTVANLTVHSVDRERGLLLIKGAVPGPKGGFVVVKPAAKVKNKGGV